MSNAEKPTSEPHFDSGSDNDSEGNAAFGDMFSLPDGFLPPEKPMTLAEHRMVDGRSIDVRLVGNHPLWGFLLWNAGRVVAEYLEVHAEELVQGKDILELGAGAGLPSCVAAIKGARTVVVTDYPDPSLVKNLQYNAERMKAQSLIPSGTKLSAEGYAWGRDIKPLNAHLPPAPELAEGAARFDLLILADVIYNYEQHHSLIKSVEMTLKRSPDASALVVSSPYEPWLWDKIIAFLPLAEQRGFEVKKLFETMVDKVMFEDDPGDEATRRTVHGYELRWKKEELDKAAS